MSSFEVTIDLLDAKGRHIDTVTGFSIDTHANMTGDDIATKFAQETIAQNPKLGLLAHSWRATLKQIS